MGSAQRVLVAPAWAPRDVVVQHHLKFLSSWHPDLELEGSAVGRSYSSRAYFRKLHHALRNAPVHLGGQLDIIVVDVPPELCELVHLVVHLVGSLYAEYGGGLSGIPFVRQHMISVLASDTVRPNAAHTTTITPFIILGYSGDCETVSQIGGVFPNINHGFIALYFVRPDGVEF